jgi:integrase
MGLVVRPTGMYRRPNGCWSLDKVVLGRRITEVLKTKSEAVAANILRQKVEDIRRDILIEGQKDNKDFDKEVVLRKLRLGKAAEIFEQKGLERVNSKDYRDFRIYALRKLCDFIGTDKPISEIKTADFIDYRKIFIERGSRPSHINNMVYLTGSSLFTFLQEEFEITGMCRVVWKKVKLKFNNERTRSLSVLEEENLYKTLIDKDYFVHRLAIKIGLRASEVISLKWRDIKTNERNMTTIVKYNRELTLPISEEVGKILASVAGDHDEYVFTYKTTRFDRKEKRLVEVRLPFTYNILSKRARTAFRAAGIEDYRFHDHRHTCATRLYKETKDPKIVQRVLGHQHAASCNRYIHAYDEDVLQAFESVDRSEAEAHIGVFTYGIALGFDSMDYVASVNRWNDNGIRVF